MSRVHFHLFNSKGELRDLEGQETEAGAHRDQAIREIRSLLASEVLTGHVDMNGRLEVTTPAGEVLDVVRFSDALSIVFDRES